MCSLCCALCYFYSDFSLTLNVFDAFSWLTWFNGTETEWKALMREDFSYNFLFLYDTGFIKPKRASSLWLIIEFQFDIGTSLPNAWLRLEMMYSPRDYVCDGLDTLLAFRQILDCCWPFWDDLNEASHCLSVFCLLLREFALSKAFSGCRGKRFLKYGSIRV